MVNLFCIISTNFIRLPHVFSGVPEECVKISIQASLRSRIHTGHERIRAERRLSVARWTNETLPRPRLPPPGPASCRSTVTSRPARRSRETASAVSTVSPPALA